MWQGFDLHVGRYSLAWVQELYQRNEATLQGGAETPPTAPAEPEQGNRNVLHTRRRYLPTRCKIRTPRRGEIWVVDFRRSFPVHPQARSIHDNVNTENRNPKHGHNDPFAWMRENGFWIKQDGASYNRPTQCSIDLSLFQMKETAITYSDGHVTINKTEKVTGKGQTYFVEKFLSAHIGQKGVRLMNYTTHIEQLPTTRKKF